MPRSPERRPNSAETRKPFFDPQRDVTQAEREGLHKRLEELRTSYPPGHPYEYFLNHAGLMAILGEKINLSDEDRKGFQKSLERNRLGYTYAADSAAMVLMGEKPDFTSDDLRRNEEHLLELEKHHVWHGVAGIASSLTVLGHRPNLTPEVIERLQQTLDSDWYEAETFHTTGNPERAAILAANLAILGEKPMISPGETGAALGMKTGIGEQQRRQMQTWLDDYRTGRRGEFGGSFPTELATAMTVLAAEKIEVPPEGGLILDGRRIGSSPEEKERG